MPRKTRPLMERIMEKVEQVGECWLWTGSTTGKGRMCSVSVQTVAGGITGSVNRILYESHGGSIPEGYVLHHTCNNSRCVNPDHQKPIKNSNALWR